MAQHTKVCAWCNRERYLRFFLPADTEDGLTSIERSCRFLAPPHLREEVVYPEMEVPDRDPVCHFYIRVSTQEQALFGLGLDAQRQAAKYYFNGPFKLMNPDIPAGEIFVDEGESAFKVRLRHRPAGRKLMGNLIPGDHLICPLHDRAFRNPLDMYETLEIWEQNGVEAHMANLGMSLSTPTGRLIVGLLVGASEWESRTKSMRLRAALANRKVKEIPEHFHRGMAPRGFTKADNPGPLFVDDNYQDLIDNLVLWRNTHGLPWEIITDLIELDRAEKMGEEPLGRKEKRIWGKSTLAVMHGRYWKYIRRDREGALKIPLISNHGKALCRKACSIFEPNMNWARFDRKVEKWNSQKYRLVEIARANWEKGKKNKAAKKEKRKALYS